MLDGTLFESYAMRGWQNLQNQELLINDMNVFPVSDGDTGTNMRLTLENGLREANGIAHLGQYMERLARGMLLGARGNSGVIFSQLIKGMSDTLSGMPEANAVELAKAFLNASRVAYNAVMHPTEGTILTVAREAAEGITALPLEALSVDELLSAYVSQMNRSLATTPDKLPVLREAGVVDSGAYGLTAFFKGFSDDELQIRETPSALSPAVFFETPSATETGSNCGFCTEFILRLNVFDSEAVESFKAYLDTMGDSLVFIRDGLDVKVHLHTDEPMAVLERASHNGVFLSIKVDNLKEMCLAASQKRDSVSNNITGRKDVAFIAVAQGDGFRNLYKEIGCDFILEQTTSVGISSADFLRIFESIPDAKIVVLPNDANIIPVARQAAQLFGEPERIDILETVSPAEGYFVMSMADLSENDTVHLIGSMRASLGCLQTITVTRAVADRSINGESCNKGDYIALSGKQLLYAATDRTDTVLHAIRPYLTDAESILVFYGATVSDADAQDITDKILAERADLDIGSFDGGQELNDYYIGIVAV